MKEGWLVVADLPEGKATALVVSNLGGGAVVIVWRVRAWAGWMWKVTLCPAWALRLLPIPRGGAGRRGELLDFRREAWRWWRYHEKRVWRDLEACLPIDAA